MPFMNELVVEVVPDGYKLTQRFDYADRYHRIIQVPVGFVTDFASIPRGFRWLVTGHDETRKAAVVHDYLCVTHKFTRKVTDQTFLDAMIESKVPFWKRTLCYAAVSAYRIVSGKK